MLLLTILTLRLEDIFINLGQKESLWSELLRIYWREWLNIAAFFFYSSVLILAKTHALLSCSISFTIHLPHYQLFTLHHALSVFCKMHLNGALRNSSLCYTDMLSYFTVTSILQNCSATVWKRTALYLCQEETEGMKHHRATASLQRNVAIMKFAY